MKEIYQPLSKQMKDYKLEMCITPYRMTSITIKNMNSGAEIVAKW